MMQTWSIAALLPAVNNMTGKVRGEGAGMADPIVDLALESESGSRSTGQCGNETGGSGGLQCGKQVRGWRGRWAITSYQGKRVRIEKSLGLIIIQFN
jgi:hypothetical protein